MKIIQETPTLLVIKDRSIIIFFIGIIFILTSFFIIFYLPHLWIGIFFALLGLFIILNAKITTLVLDKNTNKLSFIWKKLISKKTEEYDLNQIKEVELRAHYISRRIRYRRRYSHLSGYSYTLVFIFNNNQEIPLNPGESGVVRIMGRQITNERLVGGRIANFLNIPFNEKRPFTVNEVLSTVGKTVQQKVTETKQKKIK